MISFNAIIAALFVDICDLGSVDIQDSHLF